MDGLLFLAIIIAAVRYAIKEGQKTADKQKAQQRQTHWQQSQQAEQPQQATRQYHPAFDDPEDVRPITMNDVMGRAKSAAKGKISRHMGRGSMLFDSSEGEGHIDGDYLVEELTPHSDDHVVKPFTETKHIHTESTVMGTEKCPPDEKNVYEMAAPAAGREEMSDIRKAIIWSEIIGKPKALRR